MSTELEQRLRAGMDQATQGVRVPPGLALKAYRHYHKRTMTARAVTAAGAMAVLIAAALAVAGVAGAFGRSAGGQETRATAYVISRVERALSAPGTNNMMGSARIVYPAGLRLQPVPGGLTGGGPSASSAPAARSELVWAYRHTSRISAFTATGQRIFDEQLTNRNGTLTTTAVNYPSQTWWTAAQPFSPAGTQGGCLPGGGIRLSRGGGWPAFIRSQLACGAYTVAGRQTVDGVDALEITGNSGQLRLWVNPATYLPVRLDEGHFEQTDFQWLPATPANLALLNVPVPASFHQVAPPPAAVPSALGTPHVK